MDEQSSLKTQFSANDLTLKRIGKIIPLKNPWEDKGNILKVIPGGHTSHPRAWKLLLWKKMEKHWAFIYDSSQLAIRSYSFCINIIFMEPESLRLLFHRKCVACRVKNVHACMCVSHFSVRTDSVCVCERVVRMTLTSSSKSSMIKVATLLLIPMKRLMQVSTT